MKSKVITLIIALFLSWGISFGQGPMNNNRFKDNFKECNVERQRSATDVAKRMNTTKNSVNYNPGTPGGAVEESVPMVDGISILVLVAGMYGVVLYRRREVRNT